MPNHKRPKSWQKDLLSELEEVANEGPFACVFGKSEVKDCGLHLAVLVEPYLSFILDGKKTIESRFSVNRHAPYEQVCKGDVIVLKKSSGPVVGLCRVANVWFYQLMPETWNEIEQFAAALCMDDSEFWKSKKAASYATLMQIEDVVRVTEFRVDKVDPRGWVVLQPCPRAEESLF